MNDLRYGLQGDGIIARVTAANPGFTTPVYTNLSVNAAIGHVLDAIDLPAADRDIGTSSRILARWWLAADVAPWDAILRLGRTAGPRARIYESAQGRVVFRDVALPLAAAHTAAGRNRAGATDAIVSRLERVESGIDRIVNSVATDVFAEPGAGPPTRIAAIMKEDTSSGTASVSVSAAELSNAGVQAGDLLLVYLARTWARTSDRGTITTMIPSQLAIISPAIFGATISSVYVGWTRDLSELTFSSRYNAAGAETNYASMLVVAYRTNADPTIYDSFYRASTQVDTPYGIDAPGPTGVVAFPAEAISVAASLGRLPPPNNTFADAFDPISLPAGWNGFSPSGAGAFSAVTASLAAGETSPSGSSWGYAANARVIAEAGFAFTIIVPAAVPEIIWTPANEIMIDVVAGRLLTYPVAGQRPFLQVSTPSVTAGDYTAVGTASATAILSGVGATWAIEGGASGGEVTLRQLRGAFSDGGGEIQVASRNQASISAYGLRPARPDIWPYLTQAQAQALANEIVAHSANPRRSWEIVLDADRDTATETVALTADIGEVVRVSIDSDFDHLGEVVGIAHRVEGPAGLLQTTLKMLAAETALPDPNPLYLNSTANPIALDDLANPTELR